MRLAIRCGRSICAKAVDAVSEQNIASSLLQVEVESKSCRRRIYGMEGGLDVARGSLDLRDAERCRQRALAVVATADSVVPD